MTKQEKEPMVSIFDPFKNAYREVPVSIAERFVAQVEDVKRQINAVKQ